MTKIDIVSGFLGAGKTTLIKKMVKEAYQGEKLVLIENEFGEISIDGGFLKDAGIQISEMSSGCICCSLVGDFGKALREVKEQFQPDRILIEPSGVGKLSDVIVAVENTVADIPDMKLNSFVTVADAGKVKVYMKNFGEFYNNQIEAAGIILSRTQKLTQEKLEAAVALLREKNPTAAILTTPWDQLDGQAILAAVEKVSLADELLEKMRAEHEAEEAEHHHHHHEHDDDDGHDEHEHHHHHDHDDEDGHEHCCHHHHHEGEEHEDCHHHDHDDEHEHHHHHHGDGECDDPACSCHHHHHHADEVFTSWGAETPKQFTQADIDRILTALDSGEYGAILRAKGIVPAADGQWLHFDYVPQEHEVRYGAADYTGRLCVIGSQLKEDGLKTLFGL
jgi:G3E family GTPase